MKAARKLSLYHEEVLAKMRKGDLLMLTNTEEGGFYSLSSGQGVAPGTVAALLAHGKIRPLNDTLFESASQAYEAVR